MTSHWDEDQTYPVADWQYQVANDDTRQSYADWVVSQREEADEDDVQQWTAVGGLVVDQHQNVVAMRYSRKRLLEGGGMVDLMSGDHGGMENAIQPVEADENCRLMADAPRVKREHRRLREALLDMITIARAHGVTEDAPLMIKARDAVDTTA